MSVPAGVAGAEAAMDVSWLLLIGVSFGALRAFVRLCDRLR